MYTWTETVRVLSLILDICHLFCTVHVSHFDWKDSGTVERLCEQKDAQERQGEDYCFMIKGIRTLLQVFNAAIDRFLSLWILEYTWFSFA